MKQELTDDHCDACAFDSSTRSRGDFITLLEGASDLVNVALADTTHEELNQRPNTETWSKLEYVEHITEVFLFNRLICEQAISEPDKTYEGDFPPGIDTPAAMLERDAVLAELFEEARRNADLFQARSPDDWTKAAIVSDMRWTLRFGLVHSCHELLHHRNDITSAR